MTDTEREQLQMKYKFNWVLCCPYQITLQFILILKIGLSTEYYFALAINGSDKPSK